MVPPSKKCNFYSVFSRFCQEHARSVDNSPKQWDAHICMEEPFDRTNAGRAVVKRPQFEMILKSFRQADKDQGGPHQTVVSGAVEEPGSFEPGVIDLTFSVSDWFNA